MGIRIVKKPHKKGITPIETIRKAVKFVTNKRILEQEKGEKGDINV